MSHSTADKLVYMANQIGKAFARQGGEKAIAATLEHIAKFWDPRMRAKILEHLAAGGQGLDPLALEAVKRLPPPVGKTA